MKWAAGVVALLAAVGCGDDEGTTNNNGGSGGSGGGSGGAEGGTGGVPAEGVQIDGLDGSVSAHFDDRGVLSLDCASNEDCAAALGYFHARDRFVQMDIRRRITTGRLTQMLTTGVAEIGLSIDVENRARYSTRDGEPLEDAIYAQSSAESQALLDAYARGVNAWISDVKAGDNGAQFPREYANELLFDYDAQRIPEWTSSDCVATVLALVNSLTNRASLEIERGQRRAEFRATYGEVQGELMFRDLLDTRPDINSPILPGFGGATASLWRNPLTMPAGNPALSPDLKVGHADRVLFMERLIGYPGREGGFGSNNWIVSPDHSATGNALFANDPHLGMSNPALGYLAQIDSKTHGNGDIHAAGLTFAGIPYVLMGQNEFLTWGATNSNFDFTDVYIEEVSADGNTVTFKGAQVPIIKKMASFEKSDGTTVERELQFVPHHGPVLPRENEDDPLMTMRWTGHDLSTDINFFTELLKAEDVFDAQTALANLTGVGQNWVFADTQGNIAYLPYNRLPKRPWATYFEPMGQSEAVPWLPLDGRGDFEWESYYELSELPQAINPSLGYLATANNDMTGALWDGDTTDAMHGVFQTSVAPGYRHKRIMDLLAATPQHDMMSMEALIADRYSLIGEQLTPLLITEASALTLSADAQKVVAALTAWQFNCPTGLDGSDAANAPLVTDAAELSEASGCAAFHAVLREVNNRTVLDEGVHTERGPNVVVVKMLKGEPLLAGEVYWDNVSTVPVETKADILTASFEAAAAYLVSELGTDETQWAWGRIHSLNLRSDVDTASSGAVIEFNESGFANDGGLFTVDVANPTADMTQQEGAAIRLVCEALPAKPSCTVQLPGGQSAHPESSHYQDLLPDYLDNVSRPLPMDIDAAASGASETVAVSPAG